MNALTSTKVIAIIPDNIELPSNIVLGPQAVDEILVKSKICTICNISVSIFLGMLAPQIGIVSFTAFCFFNAGINQKQFRVIQNYLDTEDSLVVYTTKNIARSYFTQSRLYLAGMVEETRPLTIRGDGDEALVMLRYKRVGQMFERRCRLLSAL